ncbi:hypothetical protein GUJ93_ZPchr0004g40281 [Zizania palustris]|uniref:Uncharacterized protein n=1 Tax=Zizania palustris TaxID=103762 RepID=A0A8J5VZB9_ZIZPA|nr:hypothetical protein GUJ93_ZPchr0004g40281 [Zizania palustris]
MVLVRWSSAFGSFGWRGLRRSREEIFGNGMGMEGEKQYHIVRVYGMRVYGRLGLRLHKFSAPVTLTFGFTMMVPMSKMSKIILKGKYGSQPRPDDVDVKSDTVAVKILIVALPRAEFHSCNLVRRRAVRLLVGDAKQLEGLPSVTHSSGFVCDASGGAWCDLQGSIAYP